MGKSILNHAWKIGGAVIGVIGFGGLSDDIETWGNFISSNMPYIDTPLVQWLSIFLLGFLIADIVTRIEKWRVDKKQPAVRVRENEQKHLDPDFKIGEAIKYVVNILFPDKNPSIGNIDTEDTPATEAITKKIKSGDLQTWGKRVEIKPGIRNFKVNIDQEQFNPDDWEHRELLPLVASIPTEKKPQTRSVGRSDDQIQFTGLHVNESQVKSVRWREPTFEQNFDFYAAKKEGKLPSRISLIQIMKEAEALGWRFNSNGDYSIQKFIHLLGDAGSTGDIQFWGRELGRYDFKTSPRKLGEINRTYWPHHQVDWTSCLLLSNKGEITGEYFENSHTKTQHETNLERENLYADIHLNTQQAIDWLGVNKPEQ